MEGAQVPALLLREEPFTEHVGLYLCKKETSIVFEPSNIWGFVIAASIALTNAMRYHFEILVFISNKRKFYLGAVM